MRRLVLSVTVIALAAAGFTSSTQANPAASSSARKLTRARAETLVERKVRRIYANAIGGRTVLADCRRITRRFYDCEYGALKDSTDGFYEGLTGEDNGSIYALQGTGTVKQRRSGAVLVRVSRPS